MCNGESWFATRRGPNAPNSKTLSLTSMPTWRRYSAMASAGFGGSARLPAKGSNSVERLVGQGADEVGLGGLQGSHPGGVFQDRAQRNLGDTGRSAPVIRVRLEHQPLVLDPLRHHEWTGAVRLRREGRGISGHRLLR